MIGIKLLSDTDNARKAVLYAVQNVLNNEKNKTFVDIFFLETDEWYNRVKKVEESLFYKKV